MNDYRHIEEAAPSFAISLYKAYWGWGIGTAFMQEKIRPVMFTPCALFVVRGFGGWFAGLFIGKRLSSASKKNELY